MFSAFCAFYLLGIDDDCDCDTGNGERHERSSAPQKSGSGSGMDEASGSFSVVGGQCFDSVGWMVGKPDALTVSRLTALEQQPQQVPNNPFNDQG